MKRDELTTTLLQRDIWVVDSIIRSKSKAGNDMSIFTFRSKHCPEILVSHFQLLSKLKWFLQQLHAPDEERAIGICVRVREFGYNNGFFCINKVTPLNDEVEVPKELLDNLPF